MKVRILLADDHTVVRVGVRMLLEMSGAEVIAEVGDGREAIRLAEELKPDVAILDVTMPGLNGIDAARILRVRCPQTRVVFLSMHADSEYVHRAFAAGASGYLLKGSPSEEIVAAVSSAMVGIPYVSRGLIPTDRTQESRTGPLDSLSPRERQVLQLVVEGHSSVHIAGLVNLSPKSVDTYRSRLMKKLCVPDVTALVKFAIQHGLTSGA